MLHNLNIYLYLYKTKQGRSKDSKNTQVPQINVP